MNKPRVIRDYEKLDETVVNEIKLKFPHGFTKHLIQFKNIHGKFVSALPYESEDIYYLIRMTKQDAKEIIEEDDDYNENGQLTEDAQERLEDLTSLEELEENPDDKEEAEDY